MVQKALAQQVGVSIQLCSIVEIGLTPVAFSFGWVAYAFMSLMSTLGDHQLMPQSTDCPSIIVNCSNGFVRANQSWVLGRLLRDHECAYEVDPGRESLRIDIYELRPSYSPDVDFVWVIGWVIILVQIGISIIPWAVYQDWGIFMITCSGTILSLAAGSMRQWRSNKWSGRTLGPAKNKVTCLTRGNGNFHAMVFIGRPGSWDIESLASARSISQKETKWITITLAVLWTCLLISASGLKRHSWFLIAVGGIGMLQNVYAAGSTRKPGASNFHLRRPTGRSTIVGIQQLVTDIENSDDDDTSPDWLNAQYNLDIKNVMGALIELEKTVPTAGLALLKVFYPGGLKYRKERIRYKVERKFWKRAFRTVEGRSQKFWT